MDRLCMRATGLIGPTIAATTVHDRPITGPSHCTAVGRLAATTASAISTDKAASASGGTTTSSSKFGAFSYPFRSLLWNNKRERSTKGVGLDEAVLMEEGERAVNAAGDAEGQDGNWVLKILHVRSLWEKEKEQQGNEGEDRGVGGGDQGHDGNSTSISSSTACEENDNDDGDGDGDGECCDGCRLSEDDDENVEFDRDSFSRLLKKVSLSQAKLYAQLSYLGNLAYDIPNIKPGNLLKRHSLRYVTSSIEKREQLAAAEKKEQLANAETGEKSVGGESEDNRQENEVKYEEQNSNVRASAAFQVAASAASYLHSRTRALLPSRSLKNDGGQQSSNLDDRSNEKRNINSEMASLMATTDSVTAVVAAKEEVKQAVADDLSSISSCPCEWFICDDDKSATRYFVIQGSETLASWQANLLFEPIQFEGLDVFVHRGIYEAAKGMFQQMLPEVHAFMKTHGSCAKFRFTGHSLGGSLSLLINLMLLMRGEVSYASLLPVITFGSPCVMCGGDDLLRKLRLPKSHVQAIVMHRDIVPRAFSCNYPRPAAQLLKAVNGSFRNHPCLNSQKLLYAPMGEMLILQPDSKFSPQHDLLPSGSGLYLLTGVVPDASEAEKQLRAAKNAFLNMPHPLEILSDRSAYGSGGTIQRDHDMNSYLKCVRGVLRQELSRIRRAKREQRRKIWWPLLQPRGVETGIVLGSTLALSTGGRGQFNFASVIKTGRESLKRFSRLVASQHMHLLVVLLFPARILLIGAYSMIPR